MRVRKQTEIPSFASRRVTPFVIAGSPFRPPSLRFDNLAESWLSTSKGNIFQLGCAVLRWIRNLTQVRQKRHSPPTGAVLSENNFIDFKRLLVADEPMTWFENDRSRRTAAQTRALVERQIPAVMPRRSSSLALRQAQGEGLKKSLILSLSKDEGLEERGRCDEERRPMTMR